MGYWKARVVPRIMKLFEKDGAKKAAAEACKAFDDAKEEMIKAFEEKKAELQPKVLQLFEQSSPQIKATVREPTEGGIKKSPPAIAKFLEDLAEIGFPGAKGAGEAAGKYGAALVAGPIVFVLEKVATVLPAPPPPDPSAESAAAKEEQKETIPPETEKKEDIPEKEEKEEAKSSDAAPPEGEQKKEEIPEKTEIKEEAPPSSETVPEKEAQKKEELPEKAEEEQKKEELPKKAEEEKAPAAPSA